MILYALITLIVSILALQVKGEKCLTIHGEIRRSFVLDTVLIAGIFVILTLLPALRIGVGNDYGGYVTTNHEIYNNGYVVTEFGYNAIVKALYTISGKEDYLLVFAIFAGAIALIFLLSIKALSLDFGLSIFLFMALGIYFRSFNTIRYYLALAVSLYTLKYVIKGKGLLEWQNAIKFLIIVALSASIHKSILAIIPLYLLCSLSWNKWIYLGLAGISASVLIFQQQIMGLALKIYPSYLYTVYLEANHSILENMQAYIRCALVLIMVWICSRKRELIREEKILTNMTIMSLIIYISGYYIPFITRIAYYVLTPQIILIPSLICRVEDPSKAKRIKTTVMLVALCYFFIFLLTAGRDGVRVLPYETFLLESKEYLDRSQVY